MATTINRNPLPVNDSGSCTDGTPITREWWITHLDAIDAALAGVETQSGKPPIVFPAVAVPVADPNTLDDYEEGSWTPVDASGAGLVYSGVSGSYVKVGQMVHACGNIVFPANANGTPVAIGGLPFMSVPAAPYWGAMINYTTCNLAITLMQTIGSQQIVIFTTSGGGVANSQMSGHAIRFTAIYRAAN